MPFITVGAENGHDIDLHYDDFGTGDPVVLIHGWPLSGRSWEGQIPALVEAGHRVIAYDRRGFGQSSQPWGGYDYDTFAADLNKLITELGLSNVTLIGFSMGGGELARYASRYGTGNIKKLVFASAVPPYLWKSDDNPDGAVDQDLADWFANGITGDRPAFLHQFVDMFYTAGGEPGLLKKPLVRDDQRAYDLAIAELASPKGTLDCTVAFATTDFRDDLTKIDVPTLVIHGDADGIVPFEASGKRTAAAIPNAQTHVIEGGPHGVLASHKDEWNRAVLDFLAGPSATAP